MLDQLGWSVARSPEWSTAATRAWVDSQVGRIRTYIDSRVAERLARSRECLHFPRVGETSSNSTSQQEVEYLPVAGQEQVSHQSIQIANGLSSACAIGDDHVVQDRDDTDPHSTAVALAERSAALSSRPSDRAHSHTYSALVPQTTRVTCSLVSAWDDST